MQVIAVPVKALDRGKRRLAPVLSPSERSRLVLAMLEGVLAAALAQPGWTVWMLSPSDEALALAEAKGARPVPDRAGFLRGAIRAAEAEFGPAVRAMAVVLADLPLLTATALGYGLETSASVAVAATPAHADGGTNLLVRRPPRVIPARFGRSSFDRHRAEAYRRGLTLLDLRRWEIEFDVDTPEDLAAWSREPGDGPASREALALGLKDRLAAAAAR
jgi:2-phospho-L-lactate guanylyltransferase